MDEKTARALASLTTGIYVLTVADGSTHHGMSSSWVTQVSGEPALFSAAIDSRHLSREIVSKTGRFGLNIVGRSGKALEDYFYSAASRRPDNLASLDYSLSPQLGVPWLKLAMIRIGAQVSGSFVAGDHTIFIAELAEIEIGAADEPLTSLDLDYIYLGGKEIFDRRSLSERR